MAFTPNFLATGIGSMPFEEPDKAVGVSLAALPEAPFWPQLPQRGINEHMEVQYSEGLPRVVVERDKGRIFFDTSGDCSDDLAAFYETYMAAMDPEAGTGDCSALAISPGYAAGLHEFERRLSGNGGRRPYVKVQTTGPLSFALTVVDENKRAIYYNEEFRDVVVKGLAMKCRWQVRRLAPYAGQVICFVDEPVLAAFGSSTYVSVQRDDVVAHLREMVEAIHADGALAGIHCCGNTEWSIPIDAGMDIVNFDAFGYGETILLYADAVRGHLERGGTLAWGIVPTSVAVREQTVEGLTARLEGLFDKLAATGVDRAVIARQAMITPSCGTGSMAPADAERVFELTGAVSQAMRARYAS